MTDLTTGKDEALTFDELDVLRAASLSWVDLSANLRLRLTGRSQSAAASATDILIRH